MLDKVTSAAEQRALTGNPIPRPAFLKPCIDDHRSQSYVQRDQSFKRPDRDPYSIKLLPVSVSILNVLLILVQGCQSIMGSAGDRISSINGSSVLKGHLSTLGLRRSWR